MLLNVSLILGALTAMDDIKLAAGNALEMKISLRRYIFGCCQRIERMSQRPQITVLHRCGRRVNVDDDVRRLRKGEMRYSSDNRKAINSIHLLRRDFSRPASHVQVATSI